MSKQYYRIYMGAHRGPILVPEQKKGWFRSAQSEKRLDEFLLYETDGEYFEFFTKQPLLHEKKRYYNEFYVPNSSFSIVYGGTSDSSHELWSTDETTFRKIVEEYLEIASIDTLRRIMTEWFTKCKQEWLAEQSQKQIAKSIEEQALERDAKWLDSL